MMHLRITFSITGLVVLALLIAPFTLPAHAEPSITFTVNTADDVVDAAPGDGVCETVTGNDLCTLRAAVMEANAHIGDDTIQLSATTYDLTIPGHDEEQSARGDLDITESLTILGDPAGQTIINADNLLLDRVLEIKDSATQVTIANVQIQNGSTDENGGGIFSYAPLNLEHVHLVSNQADQLGGGIFIMQAPLTMQDCEFSGNAAGSWGGALVVYDSVLSTNTTFTSNSAGNAGAVFLGGGNYSASFIGNTFDSNTSAAAGGAMTNSAPRLIIRDSTFTNNTAPNSLGGAIFNLTHGSTITISNGHFNNNHGVEGGAIFNEFGKIIIVDTVLQANSASNFGGGLYNGIESDVQLTNVQFINNSADGPGGGISNASNLKIEFSVFTNNSAANGGGGIFNINAGKTYLSGVQLRGNSAKYGGGIDNYAGEVRIENSILDNNSASTTGGALYNYGNGNAFITNARIVNNSSGGDAGGIYHFEGKIQIAHSIINTNSAVGTGGGIYTAGTLALDAVTISANQAQAAGGIYNTGLLDISSSTLTGNSGIDNGGGITNDGNLSVENSTISRNSSNFYGGGIFNQGTVLIQSTTIAYNNIGFYGQPRTYGGGLHVAGGSSLIMRNSILYGNYWLNEVHPDDCTGTITTEHYNLIGTLDECTLNNDQGLELIGVNPLLGDLADNGGPTQTYALLQGSPAIDTANPAGCITQLGDLLHYDQRGYLRQWDGDADGLARCDIGAYEFGSVVQFFLPITQK